MTNKNQEYDFKWCPGCGDFGVRRALEFATLERNKRLDLPMENNVVVAGIGCSGNLVHLLEGSQPYGFHGIHGRSLPLAMGVKMARPELNVIVVAGDGDFLSIGAEHIAPQATRNLNTCAVVMDNGVYGLTKGQSSPTTDLGGITSSTPFGKPEDSLDPFELYMAIGVSFIASSMSSQVRELAKLIGQGMDHPGFAIVHVQSPCTTYNDTYEQLKGNVKKGIEPLAYTLPEGHDSGDKESARKVIRSPGVPLGVIFREVRPTLQQRMQEIHGKATLRTPDELLDAYDL